MDDGHMFFKLSWAYDMDTLLGRPPYKFERFLEPKTPEDEEKLRQLRQVYKMDPHYMRTVESVYGPLDWRMPETHAIYWAHVGLEKAPRNVDLMPLRRLIYQSMQLAFHRGRLVVNTADGRAEFAPNIEIVDKVNESYYQMLKLEPKVENIRQGHQNFLKSAVSTLYLYNKEADSARYWKELKRTYPETVEDWKTAEEYSIYRTTELIMNEGRDKILATIEGLLVRSYTLLAIGEYDRSTGYERMAQKVWQIHQLKVDVETKPDIRARLELGSYTDIKRRVLKDVLNPEKGFMSPALALQLKTELGLPTTDQSTGAKASAVVNPEELRKLSPKAFMAQNGKRTGMVTLPSGAQYVVIEQGTGPKPKSGVKFRLNRWTRLVDGTTILNTYSDNPTPEVDLSKEVAGLREVLPMMNQGSKWHVYLPPELAYGTKGNPPNIPPDAVIIYELYMVEVPQ
jgi:FKBP-type peptidyl-prolyl cis-trans isomerase